MFNLFSDFYKSTGKSNHGVPVVRVKSHLTHFTKKNKQISPCILNWSLLNTGFYMHASLSGYSVKCETVITFI